jgi:hypothetical protein
MKRLLGWKTLLLILGTLWAIALAPTLSWAQSPADGTVDVYFFHSETCPHCREQMPLMEGIDAYNEAIEVHIVEVNQEPEVWRTFLQERNILTTAVPRTAIGDISFVGYDPNDGPLEYSPVYSGYLGYRNQIIAAIAAAAGHEINLSATVESTAAWQRWWVLALPVLYLISWVPLHDRLQAPQKRRYWVGGLAAVVLLSLFGLMAFTPDAAIRQFAEGLPFPLFVSTIALADGFNPCAFTVLIILLSLLTYTQRRRDMALVGGTFVITSAVMYFLFIMLMIGIGAVLIDQYGTWVLSVLGIGIAIVGLINIKDYFWFKSGITLSLSAEQQRTISQRAGKIVQQLRTGQAQRWHFWGALGGTVLLAVFVNLVELGCTAILPVVYMTTLVNYCPADIPTRLFCYTGWTSIYAAVYSLPLLLILSSFIYSFKSARLTENQGRLLKLGGGLFMLFFGLIMIFRPQLLLLG